jgi:alginate O-acetyltransferase complex protein AlgI
LGSRPWVVWGLAVPGVVMLFSSYEFVLVFLPVTLGVFFALARLGRSPASLFLLLASFAFYAWWSVEYGLLIVATIVVNHFFGRHIQDLAYRGVPAAKLLLGVAIAINLGLLGYFKYRNFFVDNFNSLTGTEWPLVPLILPLAISFHTFQQIAYLVDSYQRKAERTSLTDYALFVLFFPQLIAGPIVHYSQLLPQLKRRRLGVFRYDDFAAGLVFFAIGLAKKLLIADQLAPLADSIFAGAGESPPSFTEAWVGVLAYTFGLYFDFSGYSDMAVGLARMFGIRLPYNFNSPYQATSIIDFWRCWHITLSNWLRDYLYVPLGGNRNGKTRRYVNLMITMVLGGLWHGAAWTFVLWGLLHGLYLMVNHAWRTAQTHLAARGHALVLPPIAAWALTFLAVCVAWVFFRSPTLPHALAMLEGMVGLHGLHSSELSAVFGEGRALLLGLAAAIAFLLPNSQQIVDGAGEGRERPWLRLRWQPTLRWSAAVALLLLFSFTHMSTVREFVYFQF